MEHAGLRLIVIHGPNLGSEYILQEDETTIGRSANNSIVLPSPEISRRHAHLWLDGDSILLEDLGSTNGTFVNNARLYNQVLLYDGDEVQFGDTYRLLFTSPNKETNPETPPPGDEGVETALEETGVDAQELSPAPNPLTPDLPIHLFADAQEIAPDSSLPDHRQSNNLLKIAVVLALLVVLCLLTFVFLDSYNQGRLLYCGNLKPFFNFLLGPFGFNPICP
ncbi:MAG: FHA domain-containing protein [Candidatus Promineifilaceae bacterium]